jgi:hypothetical protein
MWIIATLMVIFFISTCALAYACYNLLRKIEVYEDWLDMFRKEIDDVYKRIKAVDDKNLFEKDDDVGFVFSEIVKITKEFDEKIK